MITKKLFYYLFLFLQINNAYPYIIEKKQQHELNLLENFLNNQHLNLIENQTPVDNLKLLSIKKNHDSDDISINLNNNKSEININQNSRKCLKFDNLIFKENAIEVKNILKKLTTNHQENCLNKKILELLINEIKNLYFKKGLIADLTISKTNSLTQEFTIEINLKRISKIIYDNDNFQIFNKLTAFGFYRNNILNFNNLEQALNQINRLSSNNAKITIIPDRNSNQHLIILVNNQKKFPLKTSLIHDNLGNNFTGKYRLISNTSIDNILTLNENINLNLISNSDIKNQQKNIRSISTSISIPLNYYLINYDFSRSVFNHKINGYSNQINFSGYSQRYNFSLSKLIFKNANQEIKLTNSLTNKTSSNYINQQKIVSSQRNITTTSIALDHNYYKNNLNNLAKLTFFKGIRLLGAQSDKKLYYLGNKNYYPKAQFSLFRINNNFIKKNIFRNNKLKINFNNELEYQYTKQKLFGTEQISIGGYQSVRGFGDNFLTGDSGYILRNKLTTNLGLLINNIDKLNQIKAINFLYNSNFEIFYDYGYSRQNFTTQKKDGRLSGLGFKINFNSNNLLLSYTCSWSINKSMLLNQDLKENFINYFELSLGI